MKKIIISDVTLRDGNHAVNHSINLSIIKQYCQFAEKAKLSVIEVGHGNGIGASSLSIGRSAVSDKKIFKTARKFLKKTKLSIHSIPGFSTIEDLKLAIDEGVDIFRIGCNSTEIDIIEKQVNFCKKNNVEVWGVLMMFHLILNNKEYIKKINFLKTLGLKTVIIMDSAGCLLPSEVKKIFLELKKFKDQEKKEDYWLVKKREMDSKRKQDCEKRNNESIDINSSSRQVCFSNPNEKDKNICMRKFPPNYKEKKYTSRAENCY